MREHYPIRAPPPRKHPTADFRLHPTSRRLAHPLSSVLPTHLYAAVLAAAIILFAVPSPAHASPPDPFEGCQTQTADNASVFIEATTNFYFLGLGQAGIGEIGAFGTPEAGDKLAVLTPEGVCAGAVTWNGDMMVLTVWEDDPLTSTKDGFSTGDHLSFWMWDASSSSVFRSYYVIYDDSFDTNGSYDTDAIFVPSFAFFSPATLARTDSGTSVQGSEEQAQSAARQAGSTTPPDDFVLAANYPNPFRSTTTIRYGLPEEAAVQLDVYDALGRRVTMLVDEVQSAGWHDAVLPARGLAAGLYVVRLRAGDFVEVRQVTLAR